MLNSGDIIGLIVFVLLLALVRRSKSTFWKTAAIVPIIFGGILVGLVLDFSLGVLIADQTYLVSYPDGSTLVYGPWWAVLYASLSPILFVSVFPVICIALGFGLLYVFRKYSPNSKSFTLVNPPK